jgi:hypothetical protein
MISDPVTIARACYQAYVDKDRAAIESLIADDFHFTSPLVYFAGSSLILSPPFATGMTQIGVATSAELRSDVYGWLLERS